MLATISIMHCSEAALRLLARKISQLTISFSDKNSHPRDSSGPLIVRY
jgi:hypothetical protein